MNVTIKDIARMAGVSHTTVSRALNDSALINEETKERIKAMAKDLVYSPNMSAKSLVTHKSFHIGLFFTTLHAGTSALFFQDVVRGISRTLKDEYQLSIKGIDDVHDDGIISRRNYDGIIVMSQSPEDDHFIRKVLERHIPLVVLNRLVRFDGIVNIVSDDQKGAYQAVKYLLEQGHTRIGLIQGKIGFRSTELRTAGYHDAMREAGLEPLRTLQAFGNYDMEGAYQAMTTLLQQEAGITAVFCSSDDMAIGAIKAAGDLGYRVPGDLSVVGFDDIRFSAYLTPALTTVRRPIELISRTGAEQLLQLIGGPEGKRETKTLYTSTELIVRDSVRSQEA